MHDSQTLEDLLQEADTGGRDVWADSAYRSEEQEQKLERSEHQSQIHERAYRSKPLSES